MKRLVSAFIVLIVVAALYVKFVGIVIVGDKTGMATEVRIANASQKQRLHGLPFGYFVGIPKMEGEIEVHCSDGTSVRGGYVTPHMRDTAIVTGDGTCETFN